MAGVSFKKITCTEVPNKEDFYDVKLQTYNSVLEGRFERSQIRHMIEVLDGSINVGMKDVVEMTEVKDAVIFPEVPPLSPVPGGEA